MIAFLVCFFIPQNYAASATSEDHSKNSETGILYVSGGAEIHGAEQLSNAKIVYIPKNSFLKILKAVESSRATKVLVRKKAKYEKCVKRIEKSSIPSINLARLSSDQDFAPFTTSASKGSVSAPDYNGKVIFSKSFSKNFKLFFYDSPTEGKTNLMELSRLSYILSIRPPPVI